MEVDDIFIAIAVSLGTLVVFGIIIMLLIKCMRMCVGIWDRRAERRRRVVKHPITTEMDENFITNIEINYEY
jgi:hypothetical protein